MGSEFMRGFGAFDGVEEAHEFDCLVVGLGKFGFYLLAGSEEGFRGLGESGVVEGLEFREVHFFAYLLDLID
jgi:hypothetical protein